MEPEEIYDGSDEELDATELQIKKQIEQKMRQIRLEIAQDCMNAAEEAPVPELKMLHLAEAKNTLEIKDAGTYSVEYAAPLDGAVTPLPPDVAALVDDPRRFKPHCFNDISTPDLLGNIAQVELSKGHPPQFELSPKYAESFQHDVLKVFSLFSGKIAQNHAEVVGNALLFYSVLERLYSVTRDGIFLAIRLTLRQELFYYSSPNYERDIGAEEALLRTQRFTALVAQAQGEYAAWVQKEEAKYNQVNQVNAVIEGDQSTTEGKAQKKREPKTATQIDAESERQFKELELKAQRAAITAFIGARSAASDEKVLAISTPKKAILPSKGGAVLAAEEEGAEETHQPIMKYATPAPSIPAMDPGYLKVGEAAYKIADIKGSFDMLIANITRAVQYGLSLIVTLRDYGNANLFNAYTMEFGTIATAPVALDALTGLQNTLIAKLPEMKKVVQSLLSPMIMAIEYSVLQNMLGKPRKGRLIDTKYIYPESTEQITTTNTSKKKQTEEQARTIFDSNSNMTRATFENSLLQELIATDSLSLTTNKYFSQTDTKSFGANVSATAGIGKTGSVSGGANYNSSSTKNQGGSSTANASRTNTARNVANATEQHINEANTLRQVTTTQKTMTEAELMNQQVTVTTVKNTNPAHIVMIRIHQSVYDAYYCTVLQNMRIVCSNGDSISYADIDDLPDLLQRNTDLDENEINDVKTAVLNRALVRDYAGRMVDITVADATTPMKRRVSVTNYFDMLTRNTIPLSVKDKQFAKFWATIEGVPLNLKHKTLNADGITVDAELSENPVTDEPRNKVINAEIKILETKASRAAAELEKTQIANQMLAAFKDKVQGITDPAAFAQMYFMLFSEGGDLVAKPEIINLFGNLLNNKNRKMLNFDS
jgi:uncharacterized protein (DUF4415 family)